ncbi:hypothetical protein [Streptomyces canus]|uniref:Uncharacterized protein n=1 Tax=Streptomyces canus TaxID=58343 RepID=A0AAW8F403_9ACTN|nr:hypothetical protein [Streptomyces canus]MDQ0767068.1 hypothetical protein [Streptomyces canus]MDQ0904892.1 hypothetical protein [Streptomyces canus]MDQ1065104.1 hypothetical protein [Streptomyces canus]
MNDDELLARLRAADPAVTASAPASDINRLVEAAMTADNQTRRTPSATRAVTPIDRTARRSRRIAFAAAAVVVLVMGAGAVWQTGADHGAGGAQQTAPLALTLDGETSAKCMEPTPDLLRTFEIAFEGSVTSRNGDQVVFRIDHWFRGGDADTAQLTNDGADGGSETLAFEIGQRYLVTAQDGVVPVCGGTNIATAEGTALFHRAFDK